MYIVKKEGYQSCNLLTDIYPPKKNKTFNVRILSDAGGISFDSRESVTRISI